MPTEVFCGCKSFSITKELVGRKGFLGQKNDCSYKAWQSSGGVTLYSSEGLRNRWKITGSQKRQNNAIKELNVGNEEFMFFHGLLNFSCIFSL